MLQVTNTDFTAAWLLPCMILRLMQNSYRRESLHIKGVLTGTREKRDGQKGAPGRREMVKNKQGDGQFRAGRQGKCARRRELNSHVYIHDGVTFII